jgi:hypothetical protein
MTVRLFNAMKPLAAMLMIGATAACSSDSTSANLQPVKVSFASNILGTAGTNVAVDPAADLVLTKVQVVLDKIELNENESTSCVDEIESGDDDHGEMGGECEDVSREPVLVDIPVDATLKTVVNVPVPAGTYTKLEAKLEPARDGATAFNAANPTFVGKSVRVEGTYKGAPFVFTSPVRAGLEMAFNPPFVVDATPTNATISIDLTNWFLDRSGVVIDPGTATSGTTALQTIEDNIKRSFHAFEDEDESGRDDNGEHHGDHD